MWYQVREVKGPTELVLRAKTGWSDRCNLGYSRYIYDPAEAEAPSAAWTNSHACRYLPKANEPAARTGTADLTGRPV